MEPDLSQTELVGRGRQDPHNLLGQDSDRFSDGDIDSEGIQIIAFLIDLDRDLGLAHLDTFQEIVVAVHLQTLHLFLRIRNRRTCVFGSYLLHDVGALLDCPLEPQAVQGSESVSIFVVALGNLNFAGLTTAVKCCTSLM